MNLFTFLGEGKVVLCEDLHYKDLPYNWLVIVAQKSKEE